MFLTDFCASAICSHRSPSRVRLLQPFRAKVARQRAATDRLRRVIDEGRIYRRLTGCSKGCLNRNSEFETTDFTDYALLFKEFGGRPHKNSPVTKGIKGRSSGTPSPN